jgi:hypothetical protein
MLSQVHDHIVSELQQNARTDTIFVVTAIAFNLIVLAINSSVAIEASSARSDSVADLILAVFILMGIIINFIATMALNTGRRSRETMIEGLLMMYVDHDVAKYYNSSLVKSYNKRYVLFIGVILSLAVTSIVVPLIIRFV